MFLLILGFELLFVLSVLYLHSTMFLLIPENRDMVRQEYVVNLHSTMFLLIPYPYFQIPDHKSIYIPQCFY